MIILLSVISFIEFFVSADYRIRKDHKLLTEFTLPSNPFIKNHRKAIVRHVRGNLICCSFIENHDPERAVDHFLIA